MAHINGIGLENFRVFKEKQWFDFAPITILTGTNSSGKSSLINAIDIITTDTENTLKKDDIFENLSNLKRPDYLNKFRFSKYEFYTRRLSKRLGDFSTLQSSNDSNVNVYYRKYVSGIKIEIKLGYAITSNAVKEGVLNELVMTCRDSGNILISIKLCNGFIELIVNYGFFFRKFSLIDNDDREMFTLLQKLSEKPKIENIKEEGLDYLTNQTQSIYEYQPGQETYMDNDGDIVHEGKTSDFEEVITAFKEHYKEQISKFNSIESFFTASEKDFLNIYKVNIQATSINSKTLTHVLHIISDPIGNCL